MNEPADASLGPLDEAREANGRIRAALDGLCSRARKAEVPTLVADLGKMQAACVRLDQQLEGPPETTAEGQELRRYRHDLRTPINQLKGFSELLIEECEDEGDDRWTADLELILDETSRLRRAVDRFGRDDEQPGSERQRSRTPTGPFAAVPLHVDALHSQLRGRVLVVDDDEPNREVLSRLLQRDGFEVVTADDGHACLARMRESAVDIVLLDIVMPNLDGYETLEQIRSDPELTHVPVIMLSSLDEPSSITRCIEAGAEDHLPKPFDAVLLRARIGNSLAKKRSRDIERTYLRQIVAAKRRADELLHNVIPIGVALTSVRDEAKLLERIVREARRFCGADGGVLHLSEGEALEAVELQVETLGINAHGPHAREQAPASVSTGTGARNPVAIAAVSGKTIAIKQGDPTESGSAYDLNRLHRFETAHDYTIRSMLCLPLSTASGDVVGVLELWNPSTSGVGVTSTGASTFDESSIEILESLSLLAAAALDAYHRERALRAKIKSLEVWVDEDKRRRQVSEITETDYFKRLRETARSLRKGSA